MFFCRFATTEAFAASNGSISDFKKIDWLNASWVFNQRTSDLFKLRENP